MLAIAPMTQHRVICQSFIKSCSKWRIIGIWLQRARNIVLVILNNSRRFLRKFLILSCSAWISSLTIWKWTVTCICLMSFRAILLVEIFSLKCCKRALTIYFRMIALQILSSLFLTGTDFIQICVFYWILRRGLLSILHLLSSRGRILS